jgi:hypothetical protein
MLCRNVSLIFSMTIGTIKKELSAKPCRGPSFCFGKKKQKPWAAIIIPPIRWTDDPARAARLAAGMHRQRKAKKQSKPGGLSWIHSDAPAANGASESVLWSRKYCLTESGRRGSLFPRRPFATFGSAKVGPRQRRRGVFSIDQSMFSTIFAFAGLPACQICSLLFPVQDCSD